MQLTTCSVARREVIQSIIIGLSSARRPESSYGGWQWNCPGNGYRARGAEPLAETAEGATREEALAKLKELVEARLRAGAEVVTLRVGPETHQWMQFAGMFKDDPYFEEVKEIMAENRRKMDEDPEVP